MPKKVFEPGAAHPRWNDSPQKHWLYRRYRHMLSRCTDPTNPAWKDYGGRGISISQGWKDSFWIYAHYVESLPKPEGFDETYSIDRIDNDGDYEPGNLRWATRAEQSQNRRKPVKRNPLNKSRKLSDVEVAEIRKALENPRRGLNADLARQYNVSKTHITRIRTGVAR